MALECDLHGLRLLLPLLGAMRNPDAQKMVRPEAPVATPLRGDEEPGGDHHMTYAIAEVATPLRGDEEPP